MGQRPFWIPSQLRENLLMVFRKAAFVFAFPPPHLQFLQIGYRIALSFFLRVKDACFLLCAMPHQSGRIPRAAFLLCGGGMAPQGWTIPPKAAARNALL